MTFKRGMRGYAIILGALRDQPMTAPELSEKLGMYGNTPRIIVRQLHHRGLIHIAGWKITSVRAHAIPVYAQGCGSDAPLPDRSTGLPRSRRDYGAPTPRTEMIAFATIMEALAEPHTAKSLCELSGLYHRTVYVLIGILRKLRLVHIAGWDQTIALAPVALYQLGDKRDANRPRPKSKTDVWRTHDIRRRERAKALRVIHITAGSSLRQLAA